MTCHNVVLVQDTPSRREVSSGGQASTKEMQELQHNVENALRRLETYMESQVAKDAHATSIGSEWQEALHAHRVKLEIGVFVATMVCSCLSSSLNPDPIVLM